MHRQIQIEPANSRWSSNILAFYLKLITILAVRARSSAG